MSPFFVRVAQYEVVPRGYGGCYHAHDSMHTICCPVPLNILIGAARWVYQKALWNWVPKGVLDERIEETRHRAYRDGLKVGRDIGLEEGRRVYVEKLSEAYSWMYGKEPSEWTWFFDRNIGAHEQSRRADKFTAPPEASS